ncbi:hypothetical protein [Rhizobium grahamii]|uniref:hypothetical protein n=1 Tax=Rhizobium grahamii TaxID=1120045 RepID=UPI0011472865|nr:hypothetical protein [Rhizobium grahamii]
MAVLSFTAIGLPSMSRAVGFGRPVNPSAIRAEFYLVWVFGSRQTPGLEGAAAPRVEAELRHRGRADLELDRWMTPGNHVVLNLGGMSTKKRNCRRPSQHRSIPETKKYSPTAWAINSSGKAMSAIEWITVCHEPSSHIEFHMPLS